MDRGFMFMTKFCLLDVVCTFPGAIYMYMTIIFVIEWLKGLIFHNSS